MTEDDKDECDYDVVVVGGGCSGLVAAYHLKNKGEDLRILLLEAKDRLGGRVCGSTLAASHGEDCWDMGGQWVAGSQPNVIGLIKELGLSTFKQDCDGKKVLALTNEKIIHYDNTGTYGLSLFAALDVYNGLKKLDSFCSMIPIDDPLTCIYASEWDSKTLEQAIQSVLWSKEGQNMLATCIYVTFGVEMSQISFFYFLYFCQQCGGVAQLIDTEQKGYAQEWRVEGGAFRIVDELAESIGNERIKVSAPVISISQDDRRMAKIGVLSGEVISAKKVIVAIPPTYRAKIHFSPALPQVQMHICERMPVGHLTKVIVTYTKRFWKEQGLSGEVVHCPVYMGAEAYPVCLTFDATSSNNSPALVLFIGGKRAVDFGKLGEKEQIKSIVNSLVLFFGKAAKEPIDVRIKDWSKEPWNGGCPVSVMAPGSFSTYGFEALRKPFRRIHFAGTETAKYWSGYIDGAVQSGYRAANEVLLELTEGFKAEPEQPFEKVNEQQVISFQIERQSRNALKRGVFVIGTAVVLAEFLNRHFKLSLWSKLERICRNIITV